jgi:hypothetical protein
MSNQQLDFSDLTPAEIRDILQNATAGLWHREKGAYRTMAAIDKWLAQLAERMPDWRPSGQSVATPPSR